MKRFICDNCAESFKSENDLESHLFNNRHCEMSECPKCLRMVLKAELKDFGGICKGCADIKELNK